MKDIKELLSTPLSTMFLLVGIIVAMFSIDIVCQLIGSEFKFYGTMREFHRNNISIFLGESENNNALFLDIEDSYITEPITVAESHGNGTLRVMMLGSNYYEGLEQQFSTVNDVYFNNEDYKYGNKVAIIGKNLSKLTYKIDDELYINLQGEKYRVIDQINDDVRTQWFNAAIVPVKSMNDELVNKINVVNIYNQSQSDYIVNKFKEKFNQLQVVNLEESLSYVIDQVWAYNSGAIKSLSLGIIIGLLNCIIAALFWSKDIRKNIAIKKLLGASKSDIFFDVLYKLFIVNIAAFIVSIVLINVSLNSISNVFMTVIKYNLYCSFVAFILSILIAYIISSITLRKINSFNITDYIR